MEDVPKPVPAADEILVRIRAAGVTRSDVHLRAGEPFISRFQSGLRLPKRKILGHELAGEVEAVGAAVTEFAVGDRVFGALPYLALEGGRARGVHLCAGAVPAHADAGRDELRGRGRGRRRRAPDVERPAARGPARGQADPGLRRVRLDGDGGSPADEALRRSRHRGVQHAEHRARALARRRRGDRLPAGRLHQEPRGLRRRSSTPSASIRSVAASAR